jgi:hypothetical protein
MTWEELIGKTELDDDAWMVDDSKEWSYGRRKMIMAIMMLVYEEWLV